MTTRRIIYLITQALLVLLTFASLFFIFFMLWEAGYDL